MTSNPADKISEVVPPDVPPEAVVTSGEYWAGVAVVMFCQVVTAAVCAYLLVKRFNL